MNDRISPPNAYVKDTGTEKGRGVFAARDFEESELVEECVTVLLYQPFDTLSVPLQTRVYNWGELSGSPEASAIALGFGSLYNHDNPANMTYLADEEHSTIKYLAVRRIDKDEELTVNYNDTGGDPTSDEDDWFERNLITLIED